MSAIASLAAVLLDHDPSFEVPPAPSFDALAQRLGLPIPAGLEELWRRLGESGAGRIDLLALGGPGLYLRDLEDEPRTQTWREQGRDHFPIGSNMDFSEYVYVDVSGGGKVIRRTYLSPLEGDPSTFHETLLGNSIEHYAQLRLEGIEQGTWLWHSDYQIFVPRQDFPDEAPVRDTLRACLKQDPQPFLDALVPLIVGRLAMGTVFDLVRIGRFRGEINPATQLPHPNTGEMVAVPLRVGISLTTAASLDALLNGETPPEEPKGSQAHIVDAMMALPERPPGLIPFVMPLCEAIAASLHAKQTVGWPGVGALVPGYLPPTSKRDRATGELIHTPRRELALFEPAYSMLNAFHDAV